MHATQVAFFRRLALLAAVFGTAGQAGLARACAIDNVPSMRADRHLAVLNLATPAPAASAHWAPFIFKPLFRVNQPISLSEDSRQLAQSLPPEIVHGRWLWRFGDGQAARGQAVTHRYQRPGTYVLTVAMPLPRGGVFIFDAAVVRIQPH